MRPRQYAAEILAEPSKERRRQMLDEAPPEYRELIERHVRNAWRSGGKSAQTNRGGTSQP